VALVGNDAVPDTGEFINARSFRPSDLPTVMRKAYDLVSRLDFAN
jgi:A/G-specific adenine glycosylase